MIINELRIIYNYFLKSFLNSNIVRIIVNAITQKTLKHTIMGILKTIQRIVEIPLEEVRSNKYEQNIDNAGGEDTNTCFICGKRIKDISKAKYVQYLTTGNIISTDQDVEDSQGCFPVGSDCAKKLIINFTF